jgi:hypothetical protein
MRLSPKLLASLLSAVVLMSSVAARETPAPRWGDLTPARQQVLSPLAKEWDSYSLKQRQHLLALADKYPGMKADEKARIDARLHHWASMRKEDRIRARENYRKVQKLPPEQRAAVKRQLKQSHVLKQAAHPPLPTPPAQGASPAAAPPKP